MLWAEVLDPASLDPAGDRHRNPGVPLRTVPNSLRQAAAAAGGDALADDPRPRPPLGDAGHPDRHDPRPLARDRRDGPALDGRAPLARSGGFPTRPGDRYTALPVEIYNYAKEPNAEFQTIAAWGILHLLILMLKINATANFILNRSSRPGSRGNPPGEPSAEAESMSIARAPGPAVPKPARTRPTSAAAPAGRPVHARLVGLVRTSLALKQISIEIPRNRITALIGPSGCGKSTLLRCFNRMNDLNPNCRMEGSIEFDGEDISGPETDPVALRRRIGMVFQKPYPFPKSIYQNVAWGARINGYKGDMDELVERSLRRAALWDDVKSKLTSSGLDLSGGQQQRLCIARTLAVEPEVILMDEPCSALDPISTARVEDLMDDLKDEYTIVIVTHNMQQARRVSDMTACLMLHDDAKDGQRTGIIAEFSATDLLFTNPKDARN